MIPDPTKTKTWRTIQKHPRVTSAWKEDEGGKPSLWAELRVGWAFEGCHSAHEYTATDLLRAINSASPCSCDDCGEEEKS